MTDGRTIGTFPVELEETLKTVSAQVASVIEVVCGRTSKAKDVSTKFGIHAKLGWQMWNVAHTDPFSVIKFLPSDKGIESFIEAALSKGVPQDLTDNLRKAVSEIQGTFALHAEDREKLEMLLDSRKHPQDEESVLRWRKHAFLGNAFSFGAHAQTEIASVVLYPGQNPDIINIARIHGLVNLVRTRVGVRWPISTFTVEGSTEPSDRHHQPLVDNPGGTVPLMPDFCSDPTPKVERRVSGNVVYDEVVPGIVGLTGTCTLFTGEVIEGIGSKYAEEEGDRLIFGPGVRTPSELFISDHIVHQSLFPDVERELCVFSELINPFARAEEDRLDVPETLTYLGAGLNRVRTADVPNYAELLDHVFQRIGCPPGEFDVFRVTMPFPPIPVSVMVRHALLPRQT